MEELKELREIQRYLEDLGYEYKVTVYDFKTNKFEVTILNDYIYGEEFLKLVNEFNITLSGGYLWGVFKKTNK